MEENLNIFEFLKQLRAQRVLMVQTQVVLHWMALSPSHLLHANIELVIPLTLMQAQYNFIHDALNELILCGDTEITAANMRIAINRLNRTKDGETGYSKQFNVSWR